MCISIAFFIVGKRYYVIKPPEGNIMIRVAGCICHAIGKKYKSTEKTKGHWLEYADDKYDKELIDGIKILFRILILYIPLPIFWCLFDQSGSRWTIQATSLDGELFGFFIKADQMQSINPILIVIFIPLFEYAVYPILDKLKILQKPLQRITTGGFLAAVAFMMAGLLQFEIEKDDPTVLIPGYSELTMINNSPCLIKFTGLTGTSSTSSIDAFQSIVHSEIPDDLYTVEFTPENCGSSTPIDFSYNASSGRSSIMITLDNDTLLVLQDEETKEKTKSGEPMLKIYYNINIPQVENISFKLTSEDNEEDVFIPIESNNPSGLTSYKTMIPAKYQIFAPLTENTYEYISLAEIGMKSGGIYILSIYNKTNEDKQFGAFELVKGNHISMLLQIPQYAVITAGEILLSITGLEFSYSQAPTSMKSIIQACWLMTVAVGNLFMMIITESQLFNPLSHELFFFSVLMAADMVGFAVLAYFYKYVGKEKSNSGSVENATTNGRSNDGYEEETGFNK